MNAARKKKGNFVYLHSGVVKAVTQRKLFTTRLFLPVFQ
jgi:hypothetical protein